MRATSGFAARPSSRLGFEALHVREFVQIAVERSQRQLGFSGGCRQIRIEVLARNAHRTFRLIDADTHASVAASVSSGIPANGTSDFSEPANSITLGIGRTTAEPSFRISQTRRWRGAMPKATRTSWGTVVCPLSVRVDVNMFAHYHAACPCNNSLISLIHPPVMASPCPPKSIPLRARSQPSLKSTQNWRLQILPAVVVNTLRFDPADKF